MHAESDNKNMNVMDDGWFVIVTMTGVKKAETARRGVLLNHNHACSIYMLHDIAQDSKPGG